MMGKSGMVKSIKHYLPDVDTKDLVVRTAATVPKSWSSCGIDIEEMMKRADSKDERLGLMMRMQFAFGLRLEEALKCNPHAQDDGDYFLVLPGQGKGGRPRQIGIVDPAQRVILDFVKSRINKNEVLGWTHLTDGKRSMLKQNIQRYHNMTQALGITRKKLGITGHGLRAQFAENTAPLFPSLGGNKGLID